MELLIPGLILVALMAYASTRIKRTAAAAFEAETVETDEFIIRKPDGFLHVVNGDPQYAFEAYSKEYGGPGFTDVRQSRVTLTLYPGTTIEAEAAKRIDDGVTVVEDISKVMGERRYRVIETAVPVNGQEYRNISKISERDDSTYVLSATIVPNITPEASRGVESLINSFELK